MNSFEAYIVNLEAKLISFPTRHRIAFSASVSERLFPYYQAFSLSVSWGNPSLYRRALDVVWEQASGAQVPRSSIEELIALTDPLMPDMDEFSEFNAQWFCSACYWTLKSCEVADNVAFALAAAEAAYDRAVIWVDYSDADPAVVQKAKWESAGVMSEIREQERVLRFLDEAPLLNGDSIQQLRASLW